MLKVPYVHPGLRRKLELREQRLNNLDKVQKARLLSAIRQHFLAPPKTIQKFGKKGGAQKQKVNKNHLAMVTLQTYRRNRRITSEFVNLPIRVHNGKSFKTFLVTPEMLGYPLGGFVETRQSTYQTARK